MANFTEYYMDQGDALVTTEKQRGVAEELCVDPVKFDALICSFVYRLSELFEDGDEPLNGDETRAIAECVLDMLDYVHGNE
jgi:hypothetical protein